MNALNRLRILSSNYPDRLETTGIAAADDDATMSILFDTRTTSNVDLVYCSKLRFDWRN